LTRVEEEKEKNREGRMECWSVLRQGDDLVYYYNLFFFLFNKIYANMFAYINL